MKKKIIATLLVASMTVSSLVGVGAATTSKTAKASRTEKSWVGIPVYTIAVKGDYKTNGKKLSGHSNARTANQTHYPGWSCTKRTAKWVSKGTKSSTVRNNSTFFYGLDTQWITIGFQSFEDEIQKKVTP